MNNEFQEPKIEVSIFITVYNHGKYLSQCLDSIVSQITEFPFEVIVGEDCSTDNSREILVDYVTKYPDLIKPLLWEKNQGNKECPGKGNFIQTFYNCRGKYIVYIEGDDFLTCNDKLQIQYDFLEQNKEASACFHNAIMSYEDGSGTENHNINPINQKTKIYPEDFLIKREVWFMATAGVMFRRNLVGEKLPDWFLKSKSGDIPLYLILSNQGYIGYIDKVMSVYRRHKAGLSYTDSEFDEKFILNRIEMYTNVNKALNHKYNSQIKSIIGEYTFLLANLQNKNTFNFYRIFLAIKALVLLNKNNGIEKKTILQNLIIPSIILKKYSFWKWKLENIFTK
jgi:glycosyltransferase involved in cell wall biosynthesis